MLSNVLSDVAGHDLAVHFRSPDELRVEDLTGSRLLFLDLSLALSVQPDRSTRNCRQPQTGSREALEELTARVIDSLGSRLVRWVDHHDHCVWERYRDDSRFLLVPAAQAPACATLVTVDFWRDVQAASVDSIVCHGDLDGIISAARLLTLLSILSAKSSEAVFRANISSSLLTSLSKALIERSLRVTRSAKINIFWRISSASSSLVLSIISNMAFSVL